MGYTTLFFIIIYLFYSFDFDSDFLVGCRRLKFEPPVQGRRLKGHVISNISIGIHGSCHHFCVMKRDCVSVNIGSGVKDTVVCELNDADVVQHPQDLKPAPGWAYRGTEARTSQIISLDKLL